MNSHKVRTTMRPDKEIEVTGTELADLEAQGLVAASSPADEPPPWTPTADRPPAAPAQPTHQPAPDAGAGVTGAAPEAAAAKAKPPTRTRKAVTGDAGSSTDTNTKED